MEFITLTDATQETRTYTINVNNITCIEKYVNDDGKLFTWVHGLRFDEASFHVKETKDEILQMLKAVEKIAVLS